jgi:hypothetical protein
VATPTDAQKEAIYFYCGWPQRDVLVNTALENAIARLSQNDAQWARVANTAAATPAGLLAQLASLHDVQIPAAYRRLKADEVGTIKLTRGGEIRNLERQGRRLVGNLCTVLGVLRDSDVFEPGSGSSSAAQMGGILSRGPGDDNWVGR